MKIKLSKKQALIVLMCLEEIQTSTYWCNEESWSALVGKTLEGEREIQEVIDLLIDQYGLNTPTEIFERMFADLVVKPV